jgi:hypothetical protein
VAYYDDLDFARFSSAYRRLDPEARPSLDQYLLERSVDDGLVASYGKLAQIDTTLLERTGDHARVEVRLSYVTSLSEHRQVVVHDLVRRDGRWWLSPVVSDPSVPPDQLVRRPAVTFLSQGRRRVTTGTTAYADILDRPEVVTQSARLVRVDGRWVVIGEVFNTDVDPADVTITVQLLDARGRVLAQYNAAEIVLHKLLPKEGTPFRVEFEGIAGALDVGDLAGGAFDPNAVTPLEIDDADVASFAVYTKAVVTGRDLDRSLVAEDLSVETHADGTWLTGQLRNDGTVEVTIPHLLLTYRDADGGLAWVDHVYLDQAVRPQRSIDFRVRIDSGAGITPTALTGATYDNGIGSVATGPHGGPLLALDGAGRFAGLDVAVAGFAREDRS